VHCISLAILSCLSQFPSPAVMDLSVLTCCLTSNESTHIVHVFHSVKLKKTISSTCWHILLFSVIFCSQSYSYHSKFCSCRVRKSLAHLIVYVENWCTRESVTFCVVNITFIFFCHYVTGAKTVTVIPGQSVHQLSVADGTVHNRVVTSHVSSSIGAPHAPTTIRLANPTPNAVLLGAYGLPTAPVSHTGASSLPLTLQPLVPTVDSRHTGDRYV